MDNISRAVINMIALARHLDAAGATQGATRGTRRAGATGVIYVGFSAGALAALIAARHDPDALGAVALDLVDAQGLGERAARQLGKPLIGLSCEPTNCNANDNARAIFAGPALARSTRIPGAGHCDFEAPTDALWELVCIDPDQAQADAGRTAQLRQHVQDSALAAIEALMTGASDDWVPQAMPPAAW